MRLNKKLRERIVLTFVVFAVLAALNSCGSPPSVVPLLRIADRAMQDEAGRLDEDLQRDINQLDQSRRMLQAAFEADLAQVQQLTAEWVLEATDVYIAAREALVHHESKLRQQRERRADNLNAASEAIRRAARLLEQQDKLIELTLGLDVWRLDRSNDITR